MFPELDDIRRYCRLNGEEEKLLKSPARPIVLLARRSDEIGPRNRRERRAEEQIPGCLFSLYAPAFSPF